MDNTYTNATESKDGVPQKWNGFKYSHSRLGNVLGGIVIITVGSLLFVKQMQLITLPGWIFSWEMFLIVLGLYIGARHTFRHPGWIIPIIIGALFLIDDVFPGAAIGSYIWPVMIIGAGIFMVFKPKKKYREEFEKCGPFIYDPNYKNNKFIPDDYLDSVSIFGSVKKNIFTKDFKGGDIVHVFGGSELNFSQSDINGKVILEITQIFGGTKLILPPHWELQTELVSLMAGIEDKRPAHKELIDPTKVLVLRGTSIFGGIDIKSY